MNRFLLLITVLALALIPTTALGAHEPGPKPQLHANFKGKLIYFSPAGMEPDFDLLDRVIIQTRVVPKSGPPMTLFLDAYIENFQSDTQPVLPDLIHQKVSLSTTLGGFLSGKAIIVARNKQTVYIGDMVAEALIKPICMVQHSNPACQTEVNHMLVTVLGQGPAKRSVLKIKSSFVLNKKARVQGSIWGSGAVPSAAQTVLAQGQPHLGIKEILKDFHVTRPYQRGTGGSGKPSKGYCFQGHCTNRGTTGGSGKGSGSGTSSPPKSPTRTVTTSSRPAWMAPLGVALIVIAFILLIIFFLGQRKSPPASKGPPESESSAATPP